MCSNLITPHSLPQAKLNKLKPVYHILRASQRRDPAVNMDGNNVNGCEYVSASGTEGSSRGSEDDDFFTAARVLLSTPWSRTCGARNSAVQQLPWRLCGHEGVCIQRVRTGTEEETERSLLVAVWLLKENWYGIVVLCCLTSESRTETACESYVGKCMCTYWILCSFWEVWVAFLHQHRTDIYV